jgi:transcriptional regulator GlxA family with amidase domain
MSVDATGAEIHRCIREWLSKRERKLPKRRAVIFVYDGVQVLDVAGTAQALTTANEEGATPQYDLRICGLAGGAVTTASGFPIVAEPPPRSGKVDTVFIPGGPGVHRLRLSENAIAAIQRLSQRTRRVCAICTGAFALAETGMLDNRAAVTHWRSCDRFAREFPKINVDPEPLFIRDGNVWTTAGVTAGIDLTLSLIEDDHGSALASRVARRLVVYMKRPGGQRQYSEPMALQQDAAEPYRTLLQNIADRPNAAWSVDDMAAASAQTTRSFHRKFVAATGTTPAQAVERIRSEMARLLLQTTALKVFQIASQTGFGSETAMRRALQRQFRASARDLRERF